MGLKYLQLTTGSLFTPKRIAGLRVWLDATDSSTINSGSFANGDPVNTWVDKSTNAYSFAGAGGTRPTVQTNQLNGYPIIRSSASLLSAAVGSNLTAFTLFFVTKPTTYRQFDAIVSSNTQTSGQMTVELGSTSQFDCWFSGTGARMNTGLGTVSVNNWYIGCMTYNQATPSGVFYINNTSLGTTNQASGFFSAGNMTLFDDNSTGFTAYRGDSNQFLLYDTVLSSTDRTNVFNYLKTLLAL